MTSGKLILSYNFLSVADQALRSLVMLRIQRQNQFFPKVTQTLISTPKSLDEGL